MYPAEMFRDTLSRLLARSLAAFTAEGSRRLVVKGRASRCCVPVFRYR
jgi:hypothetical protein